MNNEKPYLPPAGLHCLTPSAEKPPAKKGSEENGSRFTSPSISLAARAINPAARLYERLGFEKVKGSEMFDPRAGWSYKMKIDFQGDGRLI